VGLVVVLGGRGRVDDCDGGGEGRGRVASQRRERSQVSRAFRWVGVRGGRGRVRVEIVWEGCEWFIGRWEGRLRGRGAYGV